jgi:hypothetical protein
MNKRLLGFLITLGAVAVLWAAEMTITSYKPDDGDSIRMINARMAAALAELVETIDGQGTNVVVTTNIGGSISTSTNINISSASANVPVYTATGTNLNVQITGGTNYIEALSAFPVYTPTDTNLNVLIVSSDVTSNLTALANALAGYGTNQLQVDATFGGTVTTDTNINISSIGVNIPIYTADGSNLVVALGDTNVGATILNTVTVTLSDTNIGATIVGGTITADTNINISSFTGVTDSTPLYVSNTSLVYVEGSVGITNTPSVTLSDTNVGSTVLNTVSVVGLTSIQTVTPYITNAAYTDGDAMSYVFSLDCARAAGKAVQLQSIAVIDADDEGMACELMLFEAAPTVAEPGEAWATSDADMLNCGIYVSIGSSDYTDLGGNRIANISAINKSITPDSGTTVYGVLRARGTSTYTATNDLTLKLVFYQD